jgi:hypothetical protein
MISGMKPSGPSLTSANVCFPPDSPSSTKPKPGRFDWAFVDPEENKLATFEARDMALPHFPRRVAFRASRRRIREETLVVVLKFLSRVELSSDANSMGQKSDD